MTQPDDPGVKPPMDSAKVRLLRVFGRHTRPEDMDLSDREFGERVNERREAALADAIIDVGE